MAIYQQNCIRTTAHNFPMPFNTVVQKLNIAARKERAVPIAIGIVPSLGFFGTSELVEELLRKKSTKAKG